MPISINYIIDYRGPSALIIEIVAGLLAYSHGAINPIFYAIHNTKLQKAYSNFFNVLFGKEEKISNFRCMIFLCFSTKIAFIL